MIFLLLMFIVGLIFIFSAESLAKSSALKMANKIINNPRIDTMLSDTQLYVKYFNLYAINYISSGIAFSLIGGIGLILSGFALYKNVKNRSMFELEKIILCNEKTSRVWINVYAEIIDDCLKISGQDIGQSPDEITGDSDYEYFYEFDMENTIRFFKILDADFKNPGPALIKKFGGAEGCRVLRKFCNDNKIVYKFYSV